MMRLKKLQQGVTLIIALIVLGVMSIAALSLIRSSDTSVTIAGNMVFKKAATAAADRGLEAARAWLLGQGTVNLYNDDAGSGYYATRQEALTDFTRAATPTNPADDINWDGANGGTTTVPFSIGADAAGNTVSYVIHRMCNLTGQPGTGSNTCDSYQTSTSSLSTQSGSAYGGGQLSGERAYYYRVTVRSVGPRNTESIVQGMILL